MRNNSIQSSIVKKYPYPRRRFTRSIIRGVISMGMSAFTQFKIVGQEKLPKNGPLIVVVNHFHFLDAVVVIRAIPWTLEFLADFEMPNVPALLRGIPDWYGTYKVAQGTANLDALQAAEAVLAQNGVLGIFPEGRLHPPPVHDALPGAAFLALRTGAPILPIGIYTDNEWKVLETIREKGRRLNVICSFGAIIGPFHSINPIRPPREELAHAGEQMMTAIGMLLPVEMRGEYFVENHPKLLV